MRNIDAYIVLSVLCLCMTVISGTDQKVSAVITGKMNDNGEYINIRGINFISMANGIWRDQVYHAVQDHAPVLGKYINPLPGYSYHMTVHPLFTERNLPEFFMKRFAPDWDNMWTHIMNLVTPHIYDLRSMIPSSLHAEYLRPLIGNGVTVLVLRLPREEATNMSMFRARIRDTIGLEMLNLLLKYAKTADERTSAQDWYEQVFVEPAQPGAAMSYKYHLTLGYSRLLAESLTTEQLNGLDEESDMVDAVVRNLICPDYEKPGDKCVLNLEPPTFDWFTSMTSFEEIQKLFNRAGRAKLSMFYKVFPVEDDPYASHTMWYICLIFVCICVCAILYYLYSRPKSCFGSLKSKRLVLPITAPKFNEHEA